MEVFIDDQSPQIIFSGPSPGWRRDSREDATVVQYLDNTFSATWTEDDMAEITFRGVGISVIGAKRDNHGVYTVKLDGKDAGSYSSYNQIDTIQTLLYSVADLDPAQPHILQIINKPSMTTPKPLGDSQSASKWLDIDGVIVTGQSSKGVIRTTVFDDSDDAFVYSDGWITRQPAVAGEHRYGNTSHGSTTNGQYVDFKFLGSSVEIFGALNVDHGNYSVILDGGAPIIYNGTGYGFIGNVSLYMATSLEEGPHTVRLTNLGVGGQWLDVDFAVVNSTGAAIVPSPLPIMSSSTSSSVPRSTSILRTSIITSSEIAITSNTAAYYPNTAAAVESGPADTQIHSSTNDNRSAAIAGGVSGALTLLVLLILLTFLYKRRKRNQVERDSMTEFFAPHGSRDSLYTIEKSGIVQAVQRKGGQAWMGDLIPPPKPRKAARKGFAARTMSTWSRTSYNTTVVGQSPFTQGLGSSRGRR